MRSILESNPNGYGDFLQLFEQDTAICSPFVKTFDMGNLP